MRTGNLASAVSRLSLSASQLRAAIRASASPFDTHAARHSHAPNDVPAGGHSLPSALTGSAQGLTSGPPTGPTAKEEERGEGSEGEEPEGHGGDQGALGVSDAQHSTGEGAEWGAGELRSEAGGSARVAGLRCRLAAVLGSAADCEAQMGNKGGAEEQYSEAVSVLRPCLPAWLEGFQQGGADAGGSAGSERAAGRMELAAEATKHKLTATDMEVRLEIQ